MSLSLAESLALAVLKGDMVAAYALADRLIEERESPVTPYEQSISILDNSKPPPDSFEVYHWPEFIAFAKRLGILYGLRTLDISIHLPLNGLVKVVQEYRATDTVKQSSHDHESPR